MKVGNFRFGLRVVDVTAHPTGVDLLFRSTGQAFRFAGDASEARRFARALVRAADASDARKRRGVR